MVMEAATPRNGSGTYSVPNPDFVPNTTILSSEVDENFDDAGDEITNSLPRDGQAGMSGQFKSSDGTVGAPGISFTLDPNTGLYRIGADNIGVAAAGAKVLDIATTGLAVTGVGSFSGDLTASAGFSVGEDIAFKGDLSPAQITSDQNDYAPTGHATAALFRLSTDASRNLTGLAGGAEGRAVMLFNIGSNNIVLKDESASSTAANRFALNADITLGADQAAIFVYDSTSSRWRAGASPFTLTAATATEYRANTADKILDTDGVWSAATTVTLTDAATVAVDFGAGINFSLTLGGNRTLGQPSNQKVGQSGFIEILQDGTGSRTLAYHADYKFTGGIDPTLSTAASTRDVLFYSVVAANVVVCTLLKAVA